MRKSRNKIMLLTLFSAGLIGASTYFMNSSLIEGSTADETAASSSEEPKGVVTATPDTSASTTVESSVVVEQPTPEAGTVVADTPPEAPVVNPEDVYTVQSGETLWEIAQTSGVSLQDLMNDNQLSSVAILEGQEIVVAK